jgi:hypothetical protein
MSIPRIRGRVGQIEEPYLDAGKWAFEISIWDLTGEHQVGEPIGPIGPYDTQELALSELKKATKLCCDVATGEPSTRYLDMKNGGIMRPWEEN